MAHTVQQSINNLRVILGETDPLNSRWQDDPHLLYYYNEARREFGKKSKAVKAVFEQTATVGATTGSNYARYTLDPKVVEVDDIFFDGEQLDKGGQEKWAEETKGLTFPHAKGTPYMWRRVGDAFDIHEPPDTAGTIEVYASIAPPAALLADSEEYLSEDQAAVAIHYAAYLVLMDDNRDPGNHLSIFLAGCKSYEKAVTRSGPRYVNQDARQV